MAVVDVFCQKPHSNDFEQEIAGRDVSHAEDGKQKRAEIEGEQTVEGSYWPREREVLLSDVIRNPGSRSILLLQDFHQALETWRALLLLLGISDI